MSVSGDDLDESMQFAAMSERRCILNWLRVVYRQNRNAQAFADAIEQEEHVKFALSKPDTGHE
jgi:hypothetical protein